MSTIKTIASLTLAFALVSPAAAVFNEAQRNGPQRIAPGSIILVHAGIIAGPAIAQIAEGFPLVRNLAGTSARILVDGRTVDAYILAAESEWVRAIVPSHTPVGDGRLIVTYNGRESAPIQIHIAERGFAIFDGTYETYHGPSFRFPRAVQNVSLSGGTRLNSLADSARPGEFIALWGTGLGAVPGDETAGPGPGALSIPALAVFVGGIPARIVYAGRSGCCAGMDQIIFEVPTGIEGCNVPVWVRFSEQGHGSNGVYVSINSRGGACSDPHGLSESDSRALADGTLPAARFHAITDDEGVEWLVQFGKAANGLKIPLGTCAYGGWDLGYSSMHVPSPLNAGESVTIRSERAAFELQNRGGNTYSGRFAGGLEAGEYSLDNGTGGPDLGPLPASFSVPRRPTFTWTNRETLKSASLGEGVSVTWTGGDSIGHVIISGMFVAGGEAWGNGEFICYEQTDKGKFTIPPALIARLASDWLGRPTYPGANSLSLWVGYRASKRFEIPGFGVGEILVGERLGTSSFTNVVLRP